jgi:hypothetical protein
MMMMMCMMMCMMMMCMISNVAHDVRLCVSNLTERRIGETKFRIVTPSTMYLVDVKNVVEKQQWLTVAEKTISAWLTNRVTFDGSFTNRISSQTF